MPTASNARELTRLIQTLRAERAQRIEAIAAIDETFAQLGISAQPHSPAAKRGRPASKLTTGNGVAKKTSRKKQPRRARQQFAQTGEASVLAFIRQQRQANSPQVNEHWRREGRQGKANNALTKLVKEGKLKRVSVKGERGGQYQLA